MLNIEVIRFEAQDVITTSVAAPTQPKPTKPAPTEAPEATKFCDLCKQDIKESEWKNECQGGWKHMFTY